MIINTFLVNLTYRELRDAYEHEMVKLRCKYNIPVYFSLRFESNDVSLIIISFFTNDKEFNTLEELIKALENKAFL